MLQERRQSGHGPTHGARNGNERAAVPGDDAQHSHDLARLSQIETVERPVHEQQRVGREQRERQHQAAAVALRQCVHALAQR